MKPFIIPRIDGASSYSVAAISAADYPISADDATPAFQAAIDDCAADGGGVVWVPAGRFTLRSPLTVKTAVTLSGSGDTTELFCYHGKSDEAAAPQITMQACTGIKNLLIFYPEQSYESPVVYSPTIRQHGVDSMTVENVTLVNPWIGIQSGPDANELHYLKNVRITPMHIGFFMDMTTDIGRMQGLHISPDYYTGYLPETDINALRKYMLANSIGVYMARSDWEYGYDISVEYCHVGFLITSFKDSGPNTQLSRLRIYNCDTGFSLINVNPFGVALSDSRIYCDIKGLNAAVESGDKFVTVMQLNSVTLSGPYRNLVRHGGSGQLSFSACVFDYNGDDYAVSKTAGGLSLLASTFSGNGGHIKLVGGAGGTQVLGCKFNGELRLSADDDASHELQMNDEYPELPLAPTGGHKPYPYPVAPSSEALYNVLDYGARRDGSLDCTAAFNTAIAAAAVTGGTVYVPGGQYRLNSSLRIPSGVELRGVFDVPCHTMGGGSVLQPYAGRGNENGEPFISLEENAGLYGLVIYYPEQSPAEPVEYPWTVRSLGRFCRVINTVFVNPWLGVDFATNPSDGHYISYISGAPIKCGIYCGNNDGEGWVENIQYNPHYWFRCSLPNAPRGDAWKAFWHNQIHYLDALKFGYNRCEHLLNTFVFAAKHGLCFYSQNGGVTSGTFIGHGTDGGENGLYLSDAGELDLINTQLVTIESPLTRIYILTDEGCGGHVRMFNTLMWGAPHYSVVVNGGDLTLVQVNYVHPGRVANTVNGGSLKVTGSYFYRAEGALKVNGGTVLFTGNMTVRRDSDRSLCDPVFGTELNGGVSVEQFNWSK